MGIKKINLNNATIVHPLKKGTKSTFNLGCELTLQQKIVTKPLCDEILLAANWFIAVLRKLYSDTVNCYAHTTKSESNKMIVILGGKFILK
jgi:hypothetical protein